MQKISIHDYQNERLIISEVPTSVRKMCEKAGEDVGEVIISALGLSSNNTEYMIGEFNLQIDVACLNEGGYGNRTRRLDEFVQDFMGNIKSELADRAAY